MAENKLRLYSSAIIDTALPANKNFMDAVAKAPGVFQDMAYNMEEIPKKAETVTTTSKGYFDGLYNDIARGLGDAASGLIGDICNGLNFADGKFFEHGVNFKKYFGEAFTSVKDAFFRMIGEMLADSVLGLFKDFFGKAAKSGIDAMTNVASTAASNAGDIVKGASGAISGLWVGLGSAVGTFLGTLLGGGKMNVNDITYWLKLIKDNSQILVNYLADTMVPATHNIEMLSFDIRDNLNDIKLTSWDQTSKLIGNRRQHLWHMGSAKEYHPCATRH